MIEWSGSVHAFQMCLQFLNQASWAFGNEDCQRSGYCFNESLYEMGAYPLMPPGARLSENPGLYNLPMRKYLLLFIVFILMTPSSFVSADVELITKKAAAPVFANCTRLYRVYPRGVAINSAKARLQKVKPSVNRSVYLRNAKLDRDKDGTACEKTSSPSPSYSSPNQPNPVNTVPISCNSISPLVTIQNSVHRTTSHRLTISFPDVLSGFEVSREVTGRITNNSSIEISVLSIVAKSLYLNGLNRDSVSYVANNSVQYFITPSSYRVAANSSLDFSYTYTQNVSSSFGSFVDSFQSSLEVKLYSLAPNCDFAR
jgi:hypothetical protein